MRSSQIVQRNGCAHSHTSGFISHKSLGLHFVNTPHVGVCTAVQVQAAVSFVSHMSGVEGAGIGGDPARDSQAEGQGGGRQGL